MKKFLLILTFMLCGINSINAADNSILVNQPAYNSMNFYVYKPANLHKDFYVTYDGFLVYKDAKGVWHYATSEKSGITRTGYVVGSVIPYVVKLKPYDAKISSVAPILNATVTEAKSNTAEKEAIENRIIYMPPTFTTPSYMTANLTPNATDWTQNSNFMSLGKWQKSIDRIGVLDKPKTPVAWKGDYPEAVFAWTGLQWKQLTPKTQHISALNILRRENYALTVHTNKLNLLRWNDSDTHVLAQYARMWGYQWLGQIFLEREY